MRRKMRLRSVVGLYWEKSTPVARLTERKMLVNCDSCAHLLGFLQRRRLPQIGMAGDAGQFLGDLSGRQHEVRCAELNAGAARHVRDIWRSVDPARTRCHLRL